LIEINISSYLNNVVGKGLKRNKQALAQTIPFILEEEFPLLNVLHLSQGVVVLEDTTSGDNGRFDVAPSFTKGCSRNKEGITVAEHLSNICSGMILVDFSSSEILQLYFYKLEELPAREDGLVVL
jgi:hypothetical protein